MTSVGITHDARRPGAHPHRMSNVIRLALLACGVLSSALYIATDIIGGLRYPGYSFWSQTISEIAAIGAPTEPVVAPLFRLYGLLAIPFAFGVLWEAGRRNRMLRATGAMMLAYMILGGIGFANAPIHQRGAGTLENDIAHVIVAAGVVFLLILTIGVGAFVLGKRFRTYSFTTIALMLLGSALTFPFAGRIAANLPTPGVGIAERVAVYAPMIWLALLGIALMRPGRNGEAAHLPKAKPEVHGFVAPGFEEVRAEFERNFSERGEIGAAVAAYWHGEKVVDLWGGRRAPAGDALPWNENTMVAVMSTTKGLSAMTLAIAASRGWLDYDAPVARYWPEFAQKGKANVTVRQLLGHQAGLVLLDEPVTLAKLHDLDYMAAMLARQKPAWSPGTRHGYHTMTIGLYMQELLRRVDPAHRSLGQVFHDEIAKPLGLDFYIGLPREIPEERIATLQTLSRTRALLALRSTPPILIRKMLPPRSLLRSSMILMNLDMNDRRTFDVELAAGNGVGTARSIARAYSAFADGGAELGITPEIFEEIIAPPTRSRSKDVVIGIPTYFSLGFLRPGPDVLFGSTQHAFGAPGAGGSFAFADPDAGIGYAYVMNKMDFHLSDDPREKPLRDALHRAVARLDARARAAEVVREPTRPQRALVG